MLTANLLPPEEKKMIAFAQYSRAVRFFGTVIAVVLLIGLVLLASSYMFLSAQKINLGDDLAAETDLAQKLRLRETFSDAAKIAGMLSDLHAFLNRPGHASDLVNLFFVDAPGIRVEFLSVEFGGDVTVSGRAQTRDDLLNFQKRLRDSNALDAITFPISDIIHSTNIRFTMNGKLKTGRGLY